MTLTKMYFRCILLSIILISGIHILGSVEDKVTGIMKFDFVALNQ
jgi:hypothetical protein